MVMIWACPLIHSQVVWVGQAGVVVPGSDLDALVGGRTGVSLSLTGWVQPWQADIPLRISAGMTGWNESRSAFAAFDRVAVRDWFISGAYVLRTGNHPEHGLYGWFGLRLDRWTVDPDREMAIRTWKVLPDIGIGWRYQHWLMEFSQQEFHLLAGVHARTWTLSVGRCF